MLLKEYIEEVCDGYIDKDVCDSDIDMLVAFVYDLGEESDNYYKFLKWLADHVKIVKENEDFLVCDFSGAFKPYNDKLKTFFNMSRSEFDEEEAYYEAVVNLEALISGNASEVQYKTLLECLH